MLYNIIIIYLQFKIDCFFKQILLKVSHPTSHNHPPPPFLKRQYSENINIKYINLRFPDLSFSLLPIRRETNWFTICRTSLLARRPRYPNVVQG